MSIIRRIRNLWLLSAYRPSGENVALPTDASKGRAPITLTRIIKPKKELAVIVEDKPIDLFPDENQEQ
jgi:hypothetical protein